MPFNVVVEAGLYVLYVRPLNGRGARVAGLFDDPLREGKEGEAAELVLQDLVSGWVTGGEEILWDRWLLG